MIGPNAQTLLKLGAMRASEFLDNNQYYRLIVPMILHAGVVHFAMNMLALWIIGTAVEKEHGSVVTGVLFVVSALGGTILAGIFLPKHIIVGASGGIFGLIGACLADIIMNWWLLFNRRVNKNDLATRARNIRVVTFLVLDILLMCSLGFVPLIDNFAHMGGLLYGIFASQFLLKKLPSDFFGFETRCIYKINQVFMQVLGLVMTMGGILVSIIILVKSDGKNPPCDRCQYVSCIPFPWWKDIDERWWNCQT